MDINEIRLQNLEVLIREFDTATEVARRAETDPAYISQLRTGVKTATGRARKLGDDIARKLEAGCEKPHGWMDQIHYAINPSSPLELAEGPRIRGEVPLISWVQAGNWCDTGDDVPEPDAWYPCPRKHGPKTFCLRVVGISNLNPNGKPSLNDGDIIFVDPEALPLPNNHSIKSCVVVRRPAAIGMETTVKQLIEENGRLYLKALNPAWPDPIIELIDGARICGVVIGKWVE